MMFCKKCGKQLNDGAKFCIECGAKISVIVIPTCMNCGKHLEEVAKFCDECGTAVEYKQPKQQDSTAKEQKKEQLVQSKQPDLHTLAPLTLNGIDFLNWQKAVQGIEEGQKNLSAEELTAFQILKELFINGNFESNENYENIEVIKEALPNHNSNRLFKVYLLNFVNLCEKYFKIEDDDDYIEDNEDEVDYYDYKDVGDGVVDDDYEDEDYEDVGEIISDAYFFMDNKEQKQGPIKVNDFPKHGVTINTLVWKIGMSEWQMAGSIPELYRIIREYAK